MFDTAHLAHTADGSFDMHGSGLFGVRRRAIELDDGWPCNSTGSCSDYIPQRDVFSIVKSMLGRWREDPLYKPPAVVLEFMKGIVRKGIPYEYVERGRFICARPRPGDPCMRRDSIPAGDALRAFDAAMKHISIPKDVLAMEFFNSLGAAPAATATAHVTADAAAAANDGAAVAADVRHSTVGQTCLKCVTHTRPPR